MDFSIPLKASSGGGSSAANYSTTVDSSYSIYNAQLKNYPVTDAFIDVNTSQEKWGIQGITERAAQNNIWKGQLSFSPTSGTGALSTHSITYPFTSNIKILEGATMQTGFYRFPGSTVTFNETSNSLATSRTNSGTSVTGKNTKSYVATSGGNKFAILSDANGVYSYAVDSNGGFTTGSILSTQTLAYTPTWSIRHSNYYVMSAKGQFTWVVRFMWDGNINNSPSRAVAVSQLYQIDSLGILSAVGAPILDNNLFTDSSGSPGTTGYSRGGSYILNDTAHAVIIGDTDPGVPFSVDADFRMYFTIDMSNTSVFTRSIIRAEGADDSHLNVTGRSNGSLNVGFDGISALLVNNNGNIFKIDATSYANTGVVPTFGIGEMAQYRQTTTVMSSDTNQVRTASDKFKIKGANTNGSISNLGANSIWLYEMTGSNNESQQSALLGVYTPNVCVASGTLTLKANGTTIDTNVLSNTINVPVSQVMNATNVTINSDRIDFELSYDNLDASDTKIGFGLNGGTYASPTGNYETSTINITL